MELPREITATGLWQRLSSEFQQRVSEFRAIASALGAEAARVVPNYTDHSVRHMDALWGVCDQVFTRPELERFSAGEAFILGCSFYLHDLGMALAATSDGLKQVQESSQYRKAVERLNRTNPDDGRLRVDAL